MNIANSSSFVLIYLWFFILLSGETKDEDRYWKIILVLSFVYSTFISELGMVSVDFNFIQKVIFCLGFGSGGCIY